MPMQLHAHPDKYLTKKLLIAAEFAGLNVQIPKNAGAEVGRIPVLETDNGCCIFSTGAIVRYLGRLRRDMPLYGQNTLEAGMIDSWMEFSTHELEVPLNTWVNAAKGMALPAEVSERAQGDTQKALAVINNHLLHFTYMVGESITLADISLACAMSDALKVVLKPNITNAFPNLMRWLKLVTGQPEVQKFLGKSDISVASSAPAAAKKDAAPKTEAAPKKEAAAKPAAKKEEAKPKAAAAPAAAGPADEAAVKACGDAIRALKEKLKGEGLSGKKVDAHPDVAALVAKLGELKKGGAAPAAAPAPAAKAAAAPAAGGDDAIKAVGDQIRVLKEKLKGEGIKGKKLDVHPDVAALVAKLQELKAAA